MLYAAGIDIGSTYSKAIILDEDLQVVGTAVRRTGYKLVEAAEGVFLDLLRNTGLTRGQVRYVMSTGYGRNIVSFRHSQVTELTAHARAVHHQFPEVRTLLDIGGQDIKAVRIDEKGRVRAFRLNDKCAAGTGAFLEKTARYLGLKTEDIAPVAVRSTKPVEISSVCAVFAESEVINHLANGAIADDVMRGSIDALAGRAVQLMRRIGLEPGFALAGGMTRNPAMIDAVEVHLKAKLRVAPDGLGQLNGAYGAALLGLLRVKKLAESGRPIPQPATAQAEDASATAFTTRRIWSARRGKFAPAATDGPGATVIARRNAKLLQIAAA